MSRLLSTPLRLCLRTSLLSYACSVLDEKGIVVVIEVHCIQTAGMHSLILTIPMVVIDDAEMLGIQPVTERIRQVKVKGGC